MLLSGLWQTLRLAKEDSRIHNDGLELRVAPGKLTVLNRF
jgi:hypothetical protein